MVPLLLLMTALAHAGGPVFHDVSLPELIERSGTVISGWPSPQKVGDCPARVGVWQVHQVQKGDPALQGKLIPIANHKYQLQNPATGKGPRYSAERYRPAPLNLDTSTSLLFLNRNQDGCFELSAQGAQEEPRNETLVRSIIDPRNCDLQLQAFDPLTGTLRRDCATDADCKPFFIHPNSCEAPLALHHSALSAVPKDWNTHLQRIRSACAQRWSQQPACEPQSPPVRCREKKCELGMRENDSVSFETAELRNGCAPHDALSITIQLRGSTEYPSLHVNWWGTGHPSATSAPFVFTHRASGYHANFCPYRRGCQQLKELKLERKGDLLEYFFRTQEGREFKGRARVKEFPGGALCG